MGTERLSIITISYNSARFLEQTIESVACQSYENIEYIVVDGGSTDETLDIIKRHECDIDNWISEPDNGISDAMNKGLAKATGDLVLFLHSDDYLLDRDSIQSAMTDIEPGYDIYTFSQYFMAGKKSHLRKSRPWDWRTNFKTPLLHQATFCTLSLFDRIGNFDMGLKIAMDYDHFLRAYRAGTRVAFFDRPISVMRDTGISSRTDWASNKTRFLEEKKIHFMQNNSMPMLITYWVYWFLYLPFRWLRSKV